MWCSGGPPPPPRACLGDSEGAESRSWMSLAMSCTAWAMMELSLPPSSPTASSGRSSFASLIRSFLQAAGLGDSRSRFPKVAVSPAGVRPALGQGLLSGSLVLLVLVSSRPAVHAALEEFSLAKRPGGSGGAVGSQKLRRCAMRAMTSCLSCSSEPISGLVSDAVGLGEGQRPPSGSASERFLKALSVSGIGPLDWSVLSVPMLQL